MLKRIAAALMCVTALASTGVRAEAPPRPPSPVSESTWAWLDRNPGGPWSAVAYSLGGREVRENTGKLVRQGMENGVSGGFQSAEELSLGIISLVKLGENPFNFEKTDLVALLRHYDDIYRDGIRGALLTLDAYDAAAGETPDASRNAESTIVDYIVSTQQSGGGFANLPGGEPDVLTTAMAVAALSSRQDPPYVGSAVSKAVNWLAVQQNPDGTFSLDNAPSCEATAAVVTALRACGYPIDDIRFTKAGSTLPNGLNRFRSPDGGYSETVGGPPEVNATEHAVIALYTNRDGISPYLPPSAYPGYAAPQQSAKEIYGKFFVNIIIIFALIYGLLIITTKIGKKWGRFPESESRPPAVEGDAQTADPRTLELHIPMQAELPDFDAIREGDSIEPGEPDKPQ